MNQPRAQRRLAAILAADVVGYSRMMREDETGTLAQLKTLRKEVFDPRIAEQLFCRLGRRISGQDINSYV